jgi:hypothetical protein
MNSRRFQLIELHRSLPARAGLQDTELAGVSQRAGPLFCNRWVLAKQSRPKRLLRLPIVLVSARGGHNARVELYCEILN